MNFNIIQLVVGSLITVISIFISNWLGRKSTKHDYQLETKNKAYQEFYIPLIKLLINGNKESMTYFWYVALFYQAPEEIRSDDHFNTLVKNNIQYLPPQVVPYIQRYSLESHGAQLFFREDGYDEDYKHHLVNASDLFDTIIKLSLQEASLLARELGYPDIAMPILETFESIEETKMNYPRYLPEIYQKSGPKQFVGEKPPRQ